MIEKLDYKFEDGVKKKHEVIVYALSTCGFCKACLKFLKDNKVAFKYVYYDLLEPATKDAVKNDLNIKYKERIMFPFVVIDGKRVVVGMKEDELKKLLEL
nr:glutaredoxin family protein [Candidatus Sigynarchaeota archaeon]